MGQEAKKIPHRLCVPLAVGDSEHKPVLLAAKLPPPRSPHDLVLRHCLLAQSQLALLARNLFHSHNRGLNWSSRHEAECIVADIIQIIRQMGAGHLADGAI